MALLRDRAITVPALRETFLITCAAPTNTGSTANFPGATRSTADVIVSTGGASTWAFGEVLDRLGPPLGARYRVAMPSAYLYGSRGSTEANAKVVLALKLQHGDSSAGGDLADYSTANQPADRTYFSTGRTSNMLTWDASLSTGVLVANSNPAYYDLTGAKRYLRVGVSVTKTLVTTESSGFEHARVGASVAFAGADRLPQVDSPKWAFSTSTTT